tara:strand:- start:44 stop:535 length:492 start_codon:yes stop_codon:yes gene_type:complete
MDKYIDMSENKWIEVYKPLTDKDNCIINYEFDDIPKDVSPYNVWTVVDGDDNVCVTCSGYHIVNRMHYHITEVAWKEGEVISTYDSVQYEFYVESCYEELDDLEHSIKKAKANPDDPISKMNLDYYGHTKKEQEESRQDIFEKIEYGKSEIKRLEKLESEEVS